MLLPCRMAVSMVRKLNIIVCLTIKKLRTPAAEVPLNCREGVAVVDVPHSSLALAQWTKAPVVNYFTNAVFKAAAMPAAAATLLLLTSGLLQIPMAVATFEVAF
jgi:hypothetical protein